MRWTTKLGACYLEVNRHKFRVWDNGPINPEPVQRVPFYSREMEDSEVVKVYDEVMDFLRG